MRIKHIKCNYEWESQSKLDYVTCPNCQRRFNKLKGGIVKNENSKS